MAYKPVDVVVPYDAIIVDCENCITGVVAVAPKTVQMELDKGK